ncbi:MAG: hypothetical protein VYD19_02490, partial [Myxococcota bacterium]|nr:hypothetical protein [Myxococcota bacterium]
IANQILARYWPQLQISLPAALRSQLPRAFFRALSAERDRPKETTVPWLSLHMQSEPLGCEIKSKAQMRSHRFLKRRARVDNPMRHAHRRGEERLQAVYEERLERLETLKAAHERARSSAERHQQRSLILNEAQLSEMVQISRGTQEQLHQASLALSRLQQRHQRAVTRKSLRERLRKTRRRLARQRPAIRERCLRDASALQRRLAMSYQRLSQLDRAAHCRADSDSLGAMIQWGPLLEHERALDQLRDHLHTQLYAACAGAPTNALRSLRQLSQLVYVRNDQLLRIQQGALRLRGLGNHCARVKAEPIPNFAGEGHRFADTASQLLQLDERLQEVVIQLRQSPPLVGPPDVLLQEISESRAEAARLDEESRERLARQERVTEEERRRSQQLYSEVHRLGQYLIKAE